MKIFMPMNQISEFMTLQVKTTNSGITAALIVYSVLERVIERFPKIWKKFDNESAKKFYISQNTNNFSRLKRRTYSDVYS